MLSRLLRHEFRATGRIMLPLIAATALLSVMSGIGIRILDDPNAGNAANIISVFILVLYILGIFAVSVVAFVLMVERFRKNLLEDEGYLMFTLPVGVDAHIFAKLIVSVIWFFVAGLVLFTVFIMLGVADATVFSGIAEGFTTFMPELGTILEYIGGGSRAAGTAHIVGYVLEVLLASALMAAMICLRFYSAMAIGYSFSNRKMLFSVLAFFAMGFLLDFLGFLLLRLVGVLGNSGMLGWLESYFKSLNGNITSVAKGIHYLLCYGILHELAISVIYYLPTKYFLKNRLNLP